MLRTRKFSPPGCLTSQQRSVHGSGLCLGFLSPSTPRFKSLSSLSLSLFFLESQKNKFFPNSRRGASGDLHYADLNLYLRGGRSSICRSQPPSQCLAARQLTAAVGAQTETAVSGDDVGGAQSAREIDGEGQFSLDFDLISVDW